MAKSITNAAPSSAVASDLLDAARACVEPPSSPATGNTNKTEPSTVRREFAIPPVLDEFLGYDVVPVMRRLTGQPVNRSTVMRELLRILLESWHLNRGELPCRNHPSTDTGVAVRQLLCQALGTDLAENAKNDEMET